MLNELKKIFADIREGKRVEQYIFATLAIVIAILGLFGIIETSIVFATILAVLALLLYGHAQNRRDYEQLTSQRKTLSIREFSSDRSTVPSVDALISNARQEVLLIGVALTSIVQTNRSLLEDLAKKGCIVKLAVWKPSSEENENRILINRLEDVIDEPDTQRSHPSNIERLKYWYSSLDKSTRQRVHIRGYSSFPTLSIIFIDKDTPHGYVHVEPIVFRAPTEKLPSFRLGVQDSSSLFEVLKNSYSRLWETAEPLVTDTSLDSGDE